MLKLVCSLIQEYKLLKKKMDNKTFIKMSNFCRGCSRELPKDRKEWEQYCEYCKKGMRFIMGAKEPKEEKMDNKNIGPKIHFGYACLRCHAPRNKYSKECPACGFRGWKDVKND